LIIIWSAYDHALPIHDSAWHLLHGLKCRDLLAHAHLRSSAWWQALLAVNPLYPPFVYLVYGTLALILGPQPWVALLARLLFSNVLFASIYGLGKLIFKNAAIALFSAVIVFIYPEVFLYTHYNMLDMPGLAMVSLVLFCLTWWQQKSSCYSSTALGLACALTALTKSSSFAFIVAPLLVSAGLSLLKRDTQRIKSLALAGLVSLTIMLPWLIFGLQPMLKAINDIQQQSSKTGCADMFSFKDNFLYYILNLPSLLSPFLLIIAIFAFCLAPKKAHQWMFYLLLSAIGGILLLSLFHWVPLVKYALPAVIPIALYTARASVSYWQQQKLRPLLIVLVTAVCFAFVEISFSPYPLPRLSLSEDVKNFLGIPLVRKGQYYPPGGISSYPMMPNDWGHDWVLNTIKPRINAKNQTLAIMSDTAEASSATYTYLAKRNNLALVVFTPRSWTMRGEDMPPFRLDSAKLVTWYLLETKGATNPAFPFFNKASDCNYQRWCSYVRKSGQFQLIGTKSLPEGNGLELYQNQSY